MTAAAARLAIRAVKRGRTVPILFDLSRLIARARHPTPTGIDRVDLAYAEALLGAERQVAFTGRLPGLGQFGFGRNHVARFVAATAARWADPDPAGAPLRHLLPGARRTAVMPAGSLRLIVAHQLLDRGDVLHRQLLRQQTRLAVFLHDAIPADYPEYARPGGDARHRRRLATAAEFAAGIIVNSAATADSLSKFLGPAPPPLLVAPLGLTPRGTVQAPAPIRPYFLVLGTIEPRKNHRLLLDVWRRLADSLPPAQMPRLVIAGRRGWANREVFERLDRCPVVAAHVDEVGRVPDAALPELITGARAVLMPSFAEGFGLPVAEALALGVPVIASNLAAHREVGGGVPDYIDPIDGPGWLAAILDHARPGSLRRRVQFQRLPEWRAPDWPGHFARVFDFLDSL
jgi:glycosyltransferase involved in cell wall biosynthesis